MTEYELRMNALIEFDISENKLLIDKQLEYMEQNNLVVVNGKVISVYTDTIHKVVTPKMLRKEREYDTIEYRMQVMDEKNAK